MNLSLLLKHTGYFIVGFFIGFVSVHTALAQEPPPTEEEVPVATIIAHKYSFGENKRDVRTRTTVLKDVDPDTCTQDAATIQDLYREQELDEAIRVGANNWSLSSEAFCSTTLVLLPSQQVTVEGVCEFYYDPNSGTSPRDQVLAQCP